jgi:hypothetical protein
MHIDLLSFRHFPRLLALFPPFFVVLNVSLSHTSNKCLLHTFLSVTFLALPALTCLSLHASNKCLLPIFLSRAFSHPSRLYIYSLPASNKCLLPIFLSVTFLALLSLFPPIFTPHLNLAGHYFNKCILPVFLSVTFLALRSLFPPIFVVF